MPPKREKNDLFSVLTVLHFSPVPISVLSPPAAGDSKALHDTPREE